jgi:vancomycin resistance protein YoaR
VLIAPTVDDIIAALQTLEPQQVVLRTRELLPRLDDGTVSAAQHEVDTLLSGPLLLQAHETSVEWPTDDLARLINVNKVTIADDQSSRLVLTLDRNDIRERLTRLAEETAYGGTLPRVDWNGGDLKIVEPGEPQYRLDVEQSLGMVLAAMRAPDQSARSLVLPFAATNPPVHAGNLHELGITEQLAVGRSDFTGSAQYRITNIIAGMNLLDNILLAPGEEFSFNQTIGTIDASNGFVEGYAIVQERTQLEWGGGICQDSTTMFRAAFWAGLPFTERHGHSFYINWYDKYGYGEYGDGPGMDATIFTGPGGPDLRFVNDTGNWLLIQTNVDPSRTLAEVLIYGTPNDRTVEFEGPEIFNRRAAPTAPKYVGNPAIPYGARKQTDTARGGMSIAFTRIIKEDGVEVDRERFVTTFEPWPNIFEVNPAELGPDGRLLPPPAPTESPTSEGGEEGAEEAEGGEEPPAPPPEEAPAPAPEEPPAPPPEEAPAPPPEEPVLPDLPPEELPDIPEGQLP